VVARVVAIHRNTRAGACDKIKLTMNDHKAPTQTRRTAVEAAMASAVFVASALQQGDATAQEYRNPFSKVRRTEDILEEVRKTPALADRQLNSPPLTEALGLFISGTAPFPDEIRELAKRHILDTLAAIIAGHDLKPAMVARRYALSQAQGAKGSLILGTRESCGLSGAIFASAMAGHATEINDYCPSAFVQPGAPIVSAAICVGAFRGLTGEALLRAVIVGYEICCRLPKALGIENLQRAGLSSHGVGPLFGTAAAIASLVRLPAARINDVLGYCVQQAAGSYEWLRDIDHIEKAYLFSGMPAQHGTEAALMVESGFTGVSDPFSNRFNSWLVSGSFLGSDSDLNRARLVDGLGQKFELPLVGYKYHPTGGPAQPGVEGVLQLIRQVDRTRVRKVRIDMPGNVPAFRDAAMPALNLRYLSSIILIDGKLDLEMAQSLDRMRNDAAVKALMQNIEVVPDRAQEREPRVESAKVTFTLEDRSVRQVFVDHVPGFPGDPLDHKQVEEKALALMSPRLGMARASQLIGRIWALEGVRNLRELPGRMVVIQTKANAG
jgi:2-methylcitrate dehydratase PrpD